MQHQHEAGVSVWFTRLALATALLTWVLIVIGAVVRVSGSGLGCGDHWPLCNGTIFPPLDDLNAWIEWTHRLVAALIGVLGLATLATGWVSQRQRRLVFGAVVVAALLYMVQAMLGAVVVWLELPKTFVALHLGTAMLLLATLLVAFVAKVYRPERRAGRDVVTPLAYITTALAFVIVLTGALVHSYGATLACVDWPLCNGALVPLGQGEAQLVHMLHRYAVLGLGIALVLLLWQVRRNRVQGISRRVALLALVLYGTQALIGAAFVMSRAQPIWGAAHVGFAAATWALLVVLSLMEYLDGRAVVPADGG